MLLCAARFTTGKVRLVGQELAPSKCVLLSTSREVRKGMKEWVLALEGDKWSVRFDVRDLGGAFGHYLRRMIFDFSCLGSSGHFSFFSYLCSSLGFSW